MAGFNCGGEGVHLKDEKPAPLRGLSSICLMLPLNHADTPPVSICEAAPVPYVSLWGTEQTSQSITGNKTDLQGELAADLHVTQASATGDAKKCTTRGDTDLLKLE